jgi:hypothetical protein
VHSTNRSAVGVAIVAAIGVGVWWVPGFASFLVLPPLMLGVGVGVVARCSRARPGALVVTATVTTALVFGFFVTRVSSYGVRGDALGNVIGLGAVIVAEAALAAAAGATLGRIGRNREPDAARSR